MTSVPLSQLSEALSGLRGSPSPAFGGAPGRDAAVALVLRPSPGLREPRVEDADILLIRRGESERDPWSGQMALPGGRFDTDDPTLAATAVRETREETALVLEPKRNLAGSLPPVQPSVLRLPPVTIWPFVFRAPPNASARPASPEVASVHWFPVRALADPARRGTYRHHTAGDARDLPCIRVGGRVVWGLTYRILTQFLAVAEDSRRRRRGQREGDRR